MKNTFLTPSAQQFGLWFQVLMSWKELCEAGNWNDANAKDRRKTDNISRALQFVTEYKNMADEMCKGLHSN